MPIRSLHRVALGTDSLASVSYGQPLTTRLAIVTVNLTYDFSILMMGCGFIAPLYAGSSLVSVQQQRDVMSPTETEAAKQNLDNPLQGIRPDDHSGR